MFATRHCSMLASRLSGCHKGIRDVADDYLTSSYFQQEDFIDSEIEAAAENDEATGNQIFIRNFGRKIILEIVKPHARPACKILTWEMCGIIRS